MNRLITTCIVNVSLLSANNQAQGNFLVLGRLVGYTIVVEINSLYEKKNLLLILDSFPVERNILKSF